MVQSLSSTNRFADSEAEAEARYQRYKSVDPFPTIYPALLNSADVEDYVAATGMIYPFDAHDLKPASHGIRVGGKCVYWDGDRETFALANSSASADGLSTKTKLLLRPNSITFVPVIPEFRLPDYIAMRFNLTIQNVYRGLLLGTGPLVDPGFNGNLWFPLHNLTTEEYAIDADDVIIYAEFTKLSRWRAWHSEHLTHPPRRSGSYVEFDPHKLAHRRDIDEYLYHANGGRPVTSSVQSLVKGVEVLREDAKSAARDAESARASVDMVRDTARHRANIIAVLSVAFTIVALAITGYGIYVAITQLTDSQHSTVAQLVQSISGAVSDTRSELARFISRADAELATHTEDITSFRQRFDADRSTLTDIDKRLAGLSNAMEQLTNLNSTARQDMQLAVQNLQSQIDDLRKRRFVRHSTRYAPQ